MDNRFHIKLREGDVASIEAGQYYVTSFYNVDGDLLAIELFSGGVELVERDDVGDDED